MDETVASWLVSPDAAKWIEQAEGMEDPSSLAAGATLRRWLPPEQAAAVLELVTLRRRARSKFGERADGAFLTRDGLEQASRPEVVAWRAARISASGVRRIVDIGCGVGTDSAAFLEAGLEVVGIEIDPVHATFAQANCSAPGFRSAPGFHMVIGDAESVDLTAWLSDPHTAIFLDPSRRNQAGRSWKVEDMRPSWDFVGHIIAEARGPVVAKLGPGFPHSLLPPRADVTWVSHSGDLLETTLWCSTSSTGLRSAVILDEHGGSIDLVSGMPVPPAGPLGRYIYDPDPAVTRARALGELAHRLDAHPVCDSIAYLTSDTASPGPFATLAAIEQTMKFSEKGLRAWVREREIGVLEIKTRGLDIDPANLRRRLHLKGRHFATVILTPTVDGVKALVVAPP